MERFSRSIKTENRPKKGYENEHMANNSIRDYIHKYYNLIRPHSHNLGMSTDSKRKVLLESLELGGQKKLDHYRQLI